MRPEAQIEGRHYKWSFGNFENFSSTMQILTMTRGSEHMNRHVWNLQIKEWNVFDNEKKYMNLSQKGILRRTNHMIASRMFWLVTELTPLKMSDPSQFWKNNCLTTIVLTSDLCDSASSRSRTLVRLRSGGWVPRLDSSWKSTKELRENWSARLKWWRENSRKLSSGS